MNVPLFDLPGQYASIAAEIDVAIKEVVSEGRYIKGPRVKEFEQAVALRLGVSHAIGVASGTDALVLALRAIGVGPKDEVILPTFTFFASAEAVASVGATPVFADCNPTTLTMDAEQVVPLITKRTRAIMPVHLFGNPCEMRSLETLGADQGIPLVEDNAQGFGSSFAGRMTGSFGKVNCLSFFPTKNLGGFGDGGMVLTDDAEMADRVAMLGTHGWREKYVPLEFGVNSRLDELQAAVLTVKLRHEARWLERRRLLAARYMDAFRDLRITLQEEQPEGDHSYHLFVIRCRDRDQVADRLHGLGISTGVYYPAPIHKTVPCERFVLKGQRFPVAEEAAGSVLALPLNAEMSDDQADEVCRSVRLILA